MKNYWLDRKIRGHETSWYLQGIDPKYSRATCAVLMESCRLRNEYDSDEEYAAYRKDLHERYQKALESNRS